MQQCGVWRPKHRPCGFICGQRASGFDALCAMHCAMLHHHCGGKLGGAVAAGMSNTLGHGPAGKQTGDAWSSRGEPQLVASQECNVARGEDHNVVCVRLRQQNLEEVFLQSVAWPLPASLSAVHLAIACCFIFLQSVWPQPTSSSRFCCDIALQPSPLPHCTPVRPRVEA